MNAAIEKNSARIGFYSALALSILTLITFGFAITAVPISGEFCMTNCIEYPYLDSIRQYPKDYIWQFLAVVQLMVFVVFSVSIHSINLKSDRIFSNIGLTFAIMSSTILISCYYLHFTVIPASQVAGETEGIPLLIQYNPHGIFIALEELGYNLMSVAFLFFGLVFSEKGLLTKFIRWFFIAAFFLTTVSYVLIVTRSGIRRDYLFEVIGISIDWLVLLVNGILVAVYFKKALTPDKNEVPLN